MSKSNTNKLNVICGNEKPLVSFVLLSYNQETFIQEAVMAALSQTYEPLEIIISDDCSRDDTFKIIQKLVHEYEGSHTILLNRNKKNLGIGPHVQYAVELSHGSYVVMAAGDDISLPNRVESSMKVIEKYGELGGVFGRYHAFCNEFIDEGKWGPSHAKDGVLFSGDAEEWLKYSNRGKTIGTPGAVAMWNRKLFDLFSPMPSGVLAEDVVLGARAFIAGLGIAFTSAKIVKYRLHDMNNYSGVKKEIFERRVFFSRALIHRDLLEFRKKNPDQYSEEHWGKMVCFIETILFRSIVICRKPVLGKIWSKILFFIGFRG